MTLITNGYIALSDLKAWLGMTTDTDDPLLEVAIESASRSIDHYCGRRFYLDTVATARTYATRNPAQVLTDDIGATGYTVATDTNESGTFDTVWDASTYQAMPNNALVQGRPITGFRAINSGSPPNTVNLFPVYTDYRYAIQVTAQWGFPSVPTEVKQATLLLAARYKIRKETPQGIISFSDMGGGMRITPIDYDVQALVSPWRKLAS